MSLYKKNFDVVIIGGGMVGLSIANQLLISGKSNNVCIIDKEKELGKHSSGRNSGVVHAGIYYKPGSLKAKVCIKGSKRLLNYAESRKLSINKCGKLIIPQKTSLDSQIDLLFNRGIKNGAQVEIIKEDKLKELSPDACSKTGRALWSPTTAVVDPLRIIKTLEKELIERGVTFIKGIKSMKFNKKLRRINLANQEYISYGFLFNCAGLQADKIAHQFEIGKEFKIIPFKGQYWKLRKDSKIKLRRNIYPVPDLNVPFLGIHFTPGAESDSNVSIGPTANFSFGRENYNGIQALEPIDAIKNLLIITKQYIQNKNGFKKYFHEQALLIMKPLIIKSAKELIPNLNSSDVVSSNKVGIRAQLFNIEKQKLEDDFICTGDKFSTHILNAISPAFTASFELADLIIENSML